MSLQEQAEQIVDAVEAIERLIAARDAYVAKIAIIDVQLDEIRAKVGRKRRSKSTNGSIQAPKKRGRRAKQEDRDPIGEFTRGEHLGSA